MKLKKTVWILAAATALLAAGNLAAEVLLVGQWWNPGELLRGSSFWPGLGRAAAVTILPTVCAAVMLLPSTKKRPRRLRDWVLGGLGVAALLRVLQFTEELRMTLDYQAVFQQPLSSLIAPSLVGPGGLLPQLALLASAALGVALLASGRKE